MAYGNNFNTLAASLAALKRRGQLTGMPLNQSDVLNIQEPYFTAARDTAGNKAALDTQANQFGLSLSEQKRQAEERLAQERQNALDQQSQAEEAQKVGKVNTAISGVGTGLLAYNAWPKATPPVTTTGAPELGTLGGPEAGEAGGVVHGGIEGGTLTSTGAEAGGGLSASSGYFGPLVAAGILGGKVTKQGEASHVTDTGPRGYFASASQHPVTSVLLPGTSLMDTGLIGKDTLIAKPWREAARIEEQIFDTLTGGCIIVTACTDKDSPEVNLTREYRDKYLSSEELRGYYQIAEKVVPLIKRHAFIKKFFKKYLVDNLIEYGKHALKKTDMKPSLQSICVTRLFLAICGFAGSLKPQFTRCNGEVV